MRRTHSSQQGWSGSNHYQQFCRGVDNFFLYRERGGRENPSGHFRQHLASPAAKQVQVHTPTSKSLGNSGCKCNSRDTHARRGQATLLTAESSSHVHGQAGGRKQCCLLQDRNKTFEKKCRRIQIAGMISLKGITKEDLGCCSLHAFLTGARYNSAHYLDRQAQLTPGVSIRRNNPSTVFTSSSFTAALNGPQPTEAAAPIVRVLNSLSKVAQTPPPRSPRHPSSPLNTPLLSEPRIAPRPCHSSMAQGAQRPVNQSHSLVHSAQDWVLTLPPRPPRVSAPASFHVVCSLSSSSTDSSTSDFIATERPFNSANVVAAGGSPLDSITLYDNIAGGIPPVNTNPIADGASPDSTSDITTNGASSYSTYDSGKSPSCSDVGSFVMSAELKLSNNELEGACWEPGRGVAERRGTPHPQGTSDLLQSYQ